MLSEGMEPNRRTLYESLSHARKVFNDTPHLIVSLMNATLRSYCRENWWEDTLYLFYKMISNSRGNDEKPNNFTIPIASVRG